MSFESNISFDELSGYVYEGVWQRFDKPYFAQFTWTLPNLRALVVMGCLTTLVTIAQTQSWSLERYVIAQFHKSVRMPDPVNPEPLLELSQGEAIMSLFEELPSKIKRLFDSARCVIDPRHVRTTEDPSSDNTHLSPWFGVISLANVVFFIFIGIAIPWWYTDGAFGAPIVKSKITNDCLTSEFSNATLFFGFLDRTTKSDEVFQQCRDRLNAGCDKQYWLTEPDIQKRRLSNCPFPEDICIPNTAPFEIEHSNISLFQVGVNSKSKISVNHRLTCAPVSLNRFTLVSATNSIITVQDVQKVGSIITSWNNLSMPLTTWNGPNPRSNQSSGLQMAQEKGPIDLHVLPGYNIGAENFDQSQEQLHRALRRDDGQSFLIIYRAGSTSYFEPINDPLFAAHNKFKPWPASFDYCADFEAAALGCVEQFQLCLADYCTPWGPRAKSMAPMIDHLLESYPGSIPRNSTAALLLEDWGNQSGLSANEINTMFGVFPLTLAVFDYLTFRITFNKMMLLTNRHSYGDFMRLLDDNDEQWTIEVETWFMKAILSAILRFQFAMMCHPKGFDSSFSDQYIREWALCGRILFRDSDHTNINWIALWTTIVSCTIICLVGNYIEGVHHALQTCLRCFVELFSWLKKNGEELKEYCATLLRSAGTYLGQLFGGICRGRRRPWSRSNARQPMPATEMPEIQNSLARQQNNLTVNTEFDYVDNPI